MSSPRGGEPSEGSASSRQQDQGKTELLEPVADRRTGVHQAVSSSLEVTELEMPRLPGHGTESRMSAPSLPTSGERPSGHGTESRMSAPSSPMSGGPKSPKSSIEPALHHLDEAADAINAPNTMTRLSGHGDESRMSAPSLPMSGEPKSSREATQMPAKPPPKWVAPQSHK